MKSIMSITINDSRLFQDFIREYLPDDYLMTNELIYTCFPDRIR